MSSDITFNSPWPGGHLPVPIFTASILELIFSGVCTSMLARYASRYGFNDQILNQFLVFVLYAATMSHTGLSCENLSEQTLQIYDHPFGHEWTGGLLIVFAPVVVAQIWAIYRVWTVSHHNKRLVTMLAIVVLGSVISYVGFVVMRAVSDSFSYDGATRSWYLAYVLLTAVADVSKSAAFVIACLRLRQQTFDARTKRSLVIMLSITIQGSVLTAICSVGMAIAALASRDTAVFTAFQMLLPSLNTFAVLHTLNSRTRTSAEAQNRARDLKSTIDSLTDGCHHLEPRRPCAACNSPSTDQVDATSLETPVFNIAAINVHVAKETKSECEKDGEFGHGHFGM